MICASACKFGSDSHLMESIRYQPLVHGRDQCCAAYVPGLHSRATWLRRGRAATALQICERGTAAARRAPYRGGDRPEIGSDPDRPICVVRVPPMVENSQEWLKTYAPEG